VGELVRSDTEKKIFVELEDNYNKKYSLPGGWHI